MKSEEIFRPINFLEDGVAFIILNQDEKSWKLRQTVRFRKLVFWCS